MKTLDLSCSCQVYKVITCNKLLICDVHILLMGGINNEALPLHVQYR